MISVCIAAYNGERFIKRQIDSILCQLGRNDEIVVADDSTTDRTAAILNNFNDHRIRVVNGAYKGSPTFNFEKAIQAAKGDFIFLSDQDDEWLPNKVKIFMSYLKEYDCIISDNIVVDGEGNVLSDSFYILNSMHQGKWYNLLIRNNYIGCCMAFRSTLLDTILPFPKTIPMHDIWIGNVAAFKYKLRFVPEKTIKFYRHSNTSSTTGHESNLSYVKQLKIRLQTCCNLFFRLMSIK